MQAVPGPTPSTRDLSDRQLLARVAARDGEAFRELYIVYHRRLARFLMRLTRRYELAEEVINDTLWVVWNRAAEFRGESRVSTWIMGIAYRRALKALRAEPALAGEAAADETALMAPDEADSAELSELILCAMQRLPAEQRLALEFAYGYGHSCEEIATIMGCPLNTVKTRLFHARQKLRELLPQLSGEAPLPQGAP
jgi:RNA polymerase sigma-70 factor (ECF subfamily)